MSEPKRTTYQLITDRLIERMEAGVNPWRKTWSVAGGAPGRDRNPVTGTQYSGINRLMTGCAGFNSPLWVTFKQARDLGGSIRKGSTGTPVVYWARVEGETDQTTGETSGGFSFLKHYYVFNLEQTEGLSFPEEQPPAPERPAFQPIESAERIVARYAGCPQIVHGGGRAYYAPQADLVAMPPRETFDNPGAYYATLFHELAHSTGHRARLNRDSLTGFASFGDHLYSKEELVAELGASFLLGESGLAAPELIDNSAAYLASWIKVLKGDSKLALQAASGAEKAANYILGV
jgi:antirestriction protein ArdC